LLTQPCFCRTLPASIPPVYLIYLSYLNSGVAFPHITCELGSLQWLPARVMSVLPRWHTQRCGRCQNSRYLYGQTRALPLSSRTCSARTSPSTILRHRPPVTRPERSSELKDDIHQIFTLSARLRLPGVKRNGRGHRRAKRRPPRLPPLCLMRYATTSPAELPDYLPYGRPFSATVAYSSPRPSASRSLFFKQGRAIRRAALLRG
jgi:hypothetical protein